MQKQCGNIYKTARKAAGLTQEQAAEMLYISTRSLAEYEAGRTVPPCDVVCRMVEVYGATWLAYMHLKTSSEVGRRFLPDLELSGLPMSVLKLQKEVDDVTNIHRDIVEVVCDGKVDEEEIPKWQNIEKEVMEMVSAGLGMLFSQKEKAVSKRLKQKPLHPHYTTRCNEGAIRRSEMIASRYSGFLKKVFPLYLSFLSILYLSIPY
ncbi:MAG: helix-turn-helix domain-containing protein [Clostridiales bacterium]|nr:helix-turn-helix domain-containing protein [Clostridiales bacterium]